MNADDPAEDLLESQMTDEPIDRRETGIRILLTLLFWLILRVAETNQQGWLCRTPPHRARASSRSPLPS